MHSTQASKPHIQTLPYRKQTLPRQKPNYGNWNRTIIASNGYFKEESVPEQQYEQAKAAYDAAQARYQALLEQKRVALSQYSEASKKNTSAEAAILRKEADLDLARLNLSYTVVTAPYDGYMGRRTLGTDSLYRQDKPFRTWSATKINGLLQTIRKRRL